MMQLYFQNNYITLYFDLQARVGKAVWRGHLRGAEIKEAYLMCQDLVDRYGLIGWLADDRLMHSIDPADLEWIVQVIIPQLATSSMLRMARLPSLFEQNREAVEVMIEKGRNYHTNLILRDFQNEQEAMDWLLEAISDQKLQQEASSV